MLSITGLTKSYGDTAILHDLSFDIGKGEIVALLGANGSGKTTILNILSGIELPLYHLSKLIKNTMI